MDVSDANYQMLYEGLRMGRDFFSRNTGRVLWCYEGPLLSVALSAPHRGWRLCYLALS